MYKAPAHRPAAARPVVSFTVEALEPRRLLAGLSAGGLVDAVAPDRAFPAYDLRPAEVTNIDLPGDPSNADGYDPVDVAVGLDRTIEAFPELTGAGQVIAVVDSGIDYDHPSLGGGYGPGFKVIGGYDFVDDDEDPMDVDGHGTAVAGVIAADPYEADGYLQQGVAPGAKLVALRVDGNGEAVPNERLEDALRWVLDHREEFGITGVNVSFGYGSFNRTLRDPFFGDELSDLHDAGVFLTSSAGNGGAGDGEGIDYPAAHPDVVSAGSIDRYGVISEFSERGPLLDLLAPGEGVMTTLPFGLTGRADGTSFSAPFVAGVAALIRQADPTLSTGDQRDAMVETASDNFDGDDEIGATTGRTYKQVDVYEAVRRVVADAPAPPAAQLLIGKGGNENDLAFARDGTLHLAWFDSTDLTLKYAARRPDGLWGRTQIVDPDGPLMGQYVSLAVDEGGVPSVAYFDGNRGDLRFASYRPEGWQTQVLDTRQSVGLYPSLAFDADNRPTIAYYFRGTDRARDGDLRTVHYDGTRWAITTVDREGDVGRSPDLKIDSQGRLNIAYDATAAGQLKFARRSTGGAWSVEVADAGPTLGTAFISLQLDRFDRPSVSYYDAGPADLKYAARSNNVWRTEVVSRRGPQGLYTALQLDRDGVPTILYYNRRDDLLMSASGGFGKWRYDVLDAGGGRYVHATPSDPRDLASDATYAYYDNDFRGLVLGVLG